MKQCKQCGNRLGWHKSVFCSSACSDAWWQKAKLVERTWRHLTCAWCGKEFDTDVSTKKYCSEKCTGKANHGVTKYKPRPARIVNCKTCGKEFEVKGKGDYCCAKHRPSYGRSNHRPRPEKHKACMDCGTEIVVTGTQKRCGACQEVKKKEWLKSAKRKRKNRLRELESTLTTKEWENALEYFGGTCAYCGSGGEMQRDHFIPAYFGGGYTKDNIVPACPRCNREKSNKMPDSWLSDRENGTVIVEKIFNFFNRNLV